MRRKKQRKKRVNANKIEVLIIILMLVFFIKKTDIIPSILSVNKNYIEDKSLDDYDYPEELLDMLSRNEEMIDYVLDYPNKKGEVYADTIGNVKKGEMPLLLQYDKGWGYGIYGDKVLAITGCGPTSLSMVIAKLVGSNEITPYQVAKYAEESGYYVAGKGTSWDLFTEGCRYFGIEGEEIPLSKELIFNVLESGRPIICSVGIGDFTTTGHIIVLNKIKGGKIQVYDSNSKERSSRLWEYERLEGQIKNLWAFSLI